MMIRGMGKGGSMELKRRSIIQTVEAHERPGGKRTNHANCKRMGRNNKKYKCVRVLL